ncbi:MAG: sigma-70 family RNA polymerase sigma factor [Planctomycetota bacterium]
MADTAGKQPATHHASEALASAVTRREVARPGDSRRDDEQRVADPEVAEAKAIDPVTRASENAPDPSPRDTREMVQAAAAGSSEAWKRLVAAYGRRVFAFLRSRCGDPELAEEITQSVFVTISEKLPAADSQQGAYVEQGTFEAWLFRIALNRLRDDARRRKRRAAAHQHIGSTAVDAIGTDTQQAEAPAEDAGLTALRVAMSGLSETDRDVIELRHHGQMSFRQISELRNEPVGTLLARHHRALRKLRDALAAAGIDPDAQQPDRDNVNGTSDAFDAPRSAGSASRGTPANPAASQGDSSRPGRKEHV